MGKLHFSARYRVGLLCAAFTLVPAVASAGTLRVDVSPTTGYAVTNRSTVALPPRTTTGPVQAYNPTFGPLAGGGAYQTTSSGITITAIKEGGSASTTMSGRMRATAGAMKNGLARCLTSFRCNAALMAGSAGIEALFGGIDYILGPGGQVLKLPTPSPATNQYFDGVYYGTNETPERFSGFSQALDSLNHSCPQQWYCSAPFVQVDSSSWCRKFPDGGCLQYVYMYGSCPYQTGDYGCRDGNPPAAPVPPPEIPPLIDSSYNPDPTDLPYLSTGGLDFGHPGVDFEITDIPSITGADNPTFIQKSDGTSTGTYSEYKFSWGGPSKQPNVDVEEKTTETTYGPSGEVTSTTTTIVNGSGSSANVPPEIPTDCAFMPTVCRFIDWFKEPDPEINQDVDFTQLIDTVDIERDFSVGASTAACPAPFVVNLSWVPSVEVSLQPFCDLADLLRPVLLAIASLFSGMIILRT